MTGHRPDHAKNGRRTTTGAVSGEDARYPPLIAPCSPLVVGLAVVALDVVHAGPDNGPAPGSRLGAAESERVLGGRPPVIGVPDRRAPARRAPADRAPARRAPARRAPACRVPGNKARTGA